MASLAEFGGFREQFVLRDDMVDGPVRERLGGRERRALEEGDQGLVGADQAVRRGLPPPPVMTPSRISGIGLQY